MFKNLDIKTIFILILAVALVLMFIFRPSKEIEDNEDEINKLKQQNIKITFHKTISEFILNSLKKEKLHARSIKDFVRNKLQVPISKFIILE